MADRTPRNEDEARKAFVNRTHEAMFKQIGEEYTRPKRAQALEDEGLGHILVWEGYERFLMLCPVR